MSAESNSEYREFRFMIAGEDDTREFYQWRLPSNMESHFNSVEDPNLDSYIELREDYLTELENEQDAITRDGKTSHPASKYCLPYFYLKDFVTDRVLEGRYSEDNEIPYLNNQTSGSVWRNIQGQITDSDGFQHKSEIKNFARRAIIEEVDVDDLTIEEFMSDLKVELQKITEIGVRTPDAERS